MSTGSLIPDRQLTFSPDLAATIGLEEAVLLQGIGPLIPRRQGQWHAFVLSSLQRQFPFWTIPQIQELLRRLADLGILALLPGDGSNSVRVAMAGSASSRRDVPQQEVTELWQPDPAVLDLLALNHGIDRQFALEQLTTFDRGSADRTRDSRFRQHVLGAWRRAQNNHPAFDVKPPPAFDNQWTPSEDAMEIMVRGGIDPEFIDSIRGEFVLYWKERGGPPKEVNSKFIGWVRQRWTRFQAGLGHSSEPKPMTRDWTPSEQVYDVLALSGIAQSFAEERLPEFILYWLDSGEVHTSWNSKFLQHTKHQYQRQQQQEARDAGQAAGIGRSGADRTRDRSIAEDLSDTSWAR